MKQLAITFLHTAGLHSHEVDGMHHIKALPWLSVVQVLEGSYEIRLGNGPMEQVPAGGFFIAPAQIQQDIWHHTDPVTGIMHSRWIFLDTRTDEGVPIDSLCVFPNTLTGDDALPLNEIFDRLFDADNPFDRPIGGYEVLKLLYSKATLPERRKSNLLKPALEMIASHYKEHLTVSQLAASVRFSPSHFHALFRREMGISPMEYLHHFRMSLAAEMILQTALPIQDIAAGVGVDDPVYFSKLFRKAYKMSPTQYRVFYTVQK